MRNPSSNQQPIVAVQQVTKVFKDFWLRDRARAVDGVSFEIHPGEVFGLLGPNGSGKSTTIKMILGLLRPTSGRIALFGKSPSEVEIKKRIGYLPEESYLYGFLNARETLEYYAKLFEIDARTRERRIDQLLDMVGLTGAQFRPVREYSKGMQRRIGLAQALINDPDFLILDEPTTGLDPVGTRQVKDLIIELGRRGKTVLLSSHLLADVEDCVDRMVILYGGLIRAEGTCDSLLTKQDRTTLEMDPLDDGTIAEIDAVLRRRTSGERAILKVGKPRQSLEALFLDIVARARQENASTSGAQNGGATADFLKGPEGSDLIEQLVSAKGGSIEGVVGPADAPAPVQPDQDLIGNLLVGKSAAASPQAVNAQAGAAATRSGQDAPSKPAPEQVDNSLINSLLNKPSDPGSGEPKP
jgi:ABC-2 type transport system ATP-binding protein